MSKATSAPSYSKRRPLASRPSSRADPPSHRASTAPPSKRQRTDTNMSTTLDLPPDVDGWSPQPSTPPQERAILVDTPLRQSTSARPQSRPTQSQHSSRTQVMSRTLSATVAEDARQRTTSLERSTMNRDDMETLLREEINLSVYQYSNFVDEFFPVQDEEKNRTVTAALELEPLFRHGDEAWSIDCSNLAALENSAMHTTAAVVLDTISRAAFTRDQFRPVHERIVPLCHQTIGADDQNDTCTVPDIVQARSGPDGIRHWSEVDFFAECKGESKTISSQNQMSKALLQLARYARATFIHQIHRRHIFSIAVCGTNAIFVRLGRTGILHSPIIDLRQNFRQFAVATARLFALDPHSFGYDTRFYYWPQLTGQEGDRTIPRELRVRTGRKRWRVLEIICQRKCLVGRATLVLLLSRVKNRKQRAVLKSIWRDESRPDEGQSLQDFVGYRGVCQSKWNEILGSTAVRDKSVLQPSPLMKSFYPDITKEDADKLRSSIPDTSSRPSRVLSALIGQAKHQQFRVEPPEDREHSMILMNAGLPLWRIQRVSHLLRTIRDALVGLAGISKQGKIHRDISEGNILCCPLRNSTADIDTELDSDSNSDTDSDSDATDFTQYFGQDSDNLSDTTVDTELNKLPLDPEGGRIDAPTYEQYVEARYTGQEYGMLYDLEFMVNQNRGEHETRGKERTGTPAFISAQLLLATEKKPVQHTFLHDLESVFWVLVWMVATHVEPGQKLNEEAKVLIDSLCRHDDRSLGEYKWKFIKEPALARKAIYDLENGWKKAGTVVQQFADFLRINIYDKEVDEAPPPSDDETILPPNHAVHSIDEPWRLIKKVIDIFDTRISQPPPIAPNSNQQD
ncbi:hypothetical protein BDV93DRAFT_607066 [Ceratobasidium sp. AG-I]|nr:hypothetical protein BDV93DRAFT_607066 [Ceratobasidium sp. AG-I]